MNKTILLTAIALGMLGIILGAFGAHGLEERLSPDLLESFETGVKYQMYHALFLLFLGLENGLKERHKKGIYLLITAGILCFSFSIYLLSTRQLTGLEIGPFALVTPLGGLLLILGWGLLGYRVFRLFT